MTLAEACLPCLMHQGMRAVRLAAPGDKALQLEAAQAWTEHLCRARMDQPPPRLAGELYGLVARLTGNADPFREHKEQANRRALALLPRLRALLDKASDPLALALAVAITGNYIDAGVSAEFDWEGELEGHANGTVPGVDHAELAPFRQALRPGARVVVLGDNAGEVVLDTLLVRALLDTGARVVYAVRGRPVLNDATLEDARAAGMDRLCEVADTGSDCPGAVPERCDPAFLDRMRAADVVLSKGQGNYESLQGRWPGVYYAFKAKCPVVSGRLGVKEGASLFVREEPETDPARSKGS